MDQKDGFEQLPQNIGRYQVQGALGFGAMGAVYKAFDPMIKRTLAIKTIRLDIPRNSPDYRSFLERFYHEARVSGTLSHPNIVTLFDIGEERGIPYLAMEYVEGETIASIIERGHRFPPEKVIGLVSQIASAVDYAHSKGVIHRDIKPSNLILFDQERVKVTDFGIAKMVDTEMTQQGQMLGTPSYMSPEQAMGEKVDGRSDIFSLGVCAFEMLSGEQPFPGNNVTAILYKLVHVPPIEPANLEMDGLVPQKWHDVFNKVLAKKPDERYQMASDFVRDLEYCLGSWFGAAMGDEGGGETVALPGLLADAPASEGSRTLPPGASGSGSGSVPTLQVMPDAAAEVELATVDLKPAGAAAAVSGATVTIPPIVLPAPAAAPPSGETARLESATVAMARPAPAPVAPAEATVMMGAGSPVPPAGATVVMDARALENLTVRMSAGADEGATVVMQASTPDAPPAGATILMQAPRVEPTVRMATPAAPRPAAPQARPLHKPVAPAPVPVRKKGSPVVLIVLGFALVLLAGASAAAYFLFFRNETTPSASPTPSLAAEPTPTPASAGTPPAVEGAISITSDPPGASVSVNGEVKGVTPLRLEALPIGEYQVEVSSRGYQPVAQAITLTEARPSFDLNLTLTRTAPSAATLTVLSTPFGAAVRIDGTPAGETPLSGHRLQPGTHRVELSKAGYEPFVETVKAAAGQALKVDATLRAEAPPPTPAAPRATPDPDKVYLNALSDVDSQARKLSGVSVSYPDRAPRLRSGESVSVKVSFVVDENGEVGDVKVVESGGKILDEAVAATVKNWKYSPAVKKGVKVKVRIDLKQTFRAG